MKVRLVSRWSEAWKWGSVQLAALLAAVAALEAQLPLLAAYLPEHWVSYACLAIIVARLLLVQLREQPIKVGGTD